MVSDRARPAPNTPEDIEGGLSMSPTADVIDIRAPRSQRVLMLSWEYPPVVVGGLGRHVHALSVALANAGHEVTVVT
ncbi:glycogen/starch synthase, partial [Micromonospora sp. LOL_023]|uniref:glycogen/starch synthase n=1 Tax=Micromonospora sp. LOL_023 TaxID=3345418 RepID=UPI003A887260